MLRLLLLAMHGKRPRHSNHAMSQLLENDIAIILSEKKGWQLVKILQEFEGSHSTDFPPNVLLHYCEHDGLDKAFFKELDELVNTLRKGKLLGMGFLAGIC